MNHTATLTAAPTDSIWHGTPSLESANERGEEVLNGRLGMELVELGDDYLVGRMPSTPERASPPGCCTGALRSRSPRRSPAGPARSPSTAAVSTASAWRSMRPRPPRRIRNSRDAGSRAARHHRSYIRRPCRAASALPPIPLRLLAGQWCPAVRAGSTQASGRSSHRRWVSPFK